MYWNLGNVNVKTYAFGTALNPNGRQIANLNQAATGNTHANYQGVLACVGINYHINWGSSPVVAKFQIKTYY